jgi:hypothetical protein
VTAADVAARLAKLHALSMALRICREEGADDEAVFCMTGHRRPLPRVSRARAHIWAVLRWSLDLSYPEVAQVFGADHTTVMVAVKKREAELAGQYAGVGA